MQYVSLTCTVNPFQPSHRMSRADEREKTSVISWQRDEKQRKNTKWCHFLKEYLKQRQLDIKPPICGNISTGSSWEINEKKTEPSTINDNKLVNFILQKNLSYCNFLKNKGTRSEGYLLVCVCVSVGGESWLALYFQFCVAKLLNKKYILTEGGGLHESKKECFWLFTFFLFTVKWVCNYSLSAFYYTHIAPSRDWLF